MCTRVIVCVCGGGGGVSVCVINNIKYLNIDINM